MIRWKTVCARSKTSSPSFISSPVIRPPPTPGPIATIARRSLPTARWISAGGKGARGNDTIGALVKTPEHQAAIAGGLCHFAGLPRVEIDGDSAVAISYLQIITPDRLAAPREVSGHGSTTGFRIHRVGANRWELKRGKDGWKVVRRTLRPLDGTDDARSLLRKAIAP